MRVTRSVCSCVNTSPFVGLTWRTNAPRRTRGLNTNTCQGRGEVLERFGRKLAGWVARAGAGDGEETQGGAQAQGQGQGQGQEPSSSSSEDMPLWVRREQAKEQSEKEEEGKTPFGVYLLASSIVAIASVSIFFLLLCFVTLQLTRLLIGFDFRLLRYSSTLTRIPSSA